MYVHTVGVDSGGLSAAPKSTQRHRAARAGILIGTTNFATRASWSAEKPPPSTPTVLELAEESVKIRSNQLTSRPRP
ncbi:hypothetical protein Y032_0352g3254 [Ancylostoma ceylanicum]|uniref:Uncharacterized protein n=1 Tax=Ancylostoma ceylanicum TaxID=53326 RepID=A0A016RX96_9BILA|nr:hypothetical protein Y032_0352g3254 [Ancylostoma ceylanicum]